MKLWVFFNELELEAPLLDVQVARHWHTIHRGQFLPFSFLLARWRGFEEWAAESCSLPHLILRINHARLTIHRILWRRGNIPLLEVKTHAQAIGEGDSELVSFLSASNISPHSRVWSQDTYLYRLVSLAPIRVGCSDLRSLSAEGSFAIKMHGV